MAKCLVTGGAGFMGSHVARTLLERGHEVVVLDDMSGGFPANVPSDAKLIEGSITDDALVSRTFSAERFDYVYHLAAYAAEGLSHFIKRFNYSNNVLGSVTLINAAVNHGVGCFVFTSSIAVYGSGQLPLVESLRPQPEDSYGIAKYAVEQELGVSKQMFDLDYVIFRPHNVYGELQNIGDRYRNVLGIFMNQILNDQPLSIFGDGKQTRAFSYIRDIAPTIAGSPEVADARCEIFNIGADVPYTVNHLAHTVKDAMGVPNHPIRHLDARSEVKHAFSDHAKAEGTFGPQTSTSLEEGVGRMTGWVKEHGPQPPTRFTNIEITRNLPPSWLEETPAARVPSSSSLSD
jgi:UDP-glucose 4-epimerase